MCSLAGAAPPPAPPPLTLAADGVAHMEISAPSQGAAADKLERYLERISGADFRRSEKTEPGARAIHVGLVSDFPWLDQAEGKRLGEEGFILRSDATARQLYLVAASPVGVRHAVTTFLQRLGCRWFFPGQAWEVIPPAGDTAWDLERTQLAEFPHAAEDLVWVRRLRAREENPRRLGALQPPGRTGRGQHRPQLARARSRARFRRAPRMVRAGRWQTRASKPCYSHPEVTARAIESALGQARRGRKMISMSPPDGLGYCECERCLAVFQGAEPLREHGSLFAERPDRILVNVTSETPVRLRQPHRRRGRPRTPGGADRLLRLQRLLAPTVIRPASEPLPADHHPLPPHATGARGTARGLRRARLSGRHPRILQRVPVGLGLPRSGKVTPQQLQKDLRLYRQHGITAINAEASNNWAPRGSATTSRHS